MRKIKKTFAIVMASLFVLAMGMIYANAAMEVFFYRNERTGTEGTSEFVMTTDYYPSTTKAQVTSTITCDTGHTVLSRSTGYIELLNGTKVYFSQISPEISPSTSYISFAYTNLNSYWFAINDVEQVVGIHFFLYDGFEVDYPDLNNETSLYNGGTF